MHRKRKKVKVVRFELMRPDEILAAKQEKSIAYLPIGPLEWHGPAMPFGTDPLAAQEITREAARRFGGVVLPTLFCGTERERTPELLEAKGFSDVDQYIVGMDVPANTVKSLYTKEDMFSMMVREYIRLLVEQGYQLIVLVNGHGATGQMYQLNRLAVEYSNESSSRVMVSFPLTHADPGDQDFGHATRFETSLQMYLNPQSVDLDRLPSRDIKLKNTDWGIADGCTFALQPNEDKTVVFDPRDATAAQGKADFEASVNTLLRQVSEAWTELKKEK